jgi:hypothetical protein
MDVYGGDEMRLSEKLILSNIKHGHRKKIIAHRDGAAISKRHPVIFPSTLLNQDIINSSILYTYNFSQQNQYIQPIRTNKEDDLFCRTYVATRQLLQKSCCYAILHCISSRAIHRAVLLSLGAN